MRRLLKRETLTMAWQCSPQPSRAENVATSAWWNLADMVVSQRKQGCCFGRCKVVSR